MCEWFASNAVFTFAGDSDESAHRRLLAFSLVALVRYFGHEFNWRYRRGINSLRQTQRIIAVADSRAPVYSATDFWGQCSAERRRSSALFDAVSGLGCNGIIGIIIGAFRNYGRT